MAVAYLFLFSYFVNANEEIYFYHNDQYGNPVVITDLKGNVVWNESSEPNNSILPSTFERDNTGLIFDRSRYYDPETGRYLTPDRQSAVENPVITKPDEQMQYTGLITEQNSEIAKISSNKAWMTLSDPMWWFRSENPLQSREHNINNRAFIAGSLFPISIVKRSRLLLRNMQIPRTILKKSIFPNRNL